MSPDLAMISDGKKFMWDGQLYDNREEAARVGETYQKENFQIADRGRRREVPGVHQKDRQGMGNHCAVAGRDSR